jgi:hypothetical protein
MLRYRPTPAPRPRLRAPIRWPCWARRGWPRPGWHRRALPDRPADGGGRCGPCCGRGRGRVAGKPCQHRSDRLGLLLRKEAASLTAQQLHLVGEPWRPRSWPSTTAAALAGGGSSGLACRWLGTRIGVGHVRLLARHRRRLAPLAAFTAEFHGWGVSHPIPIVSRSRRSGRPRGRLRQRRRACRPDDDPAPRLHDEVALSVQRHGDPANPGWTAAGRRGWLGSPSATGQRMLAATARVPPSGGASVRSPADHRPFRRSAARSSVDHPPLGGAAGAGPRDTKEATRRPRRAAAPIPRCSEGSRCATRSSHPVRQPQEPRTREQHPAPDRAAAPSRPDTYPAAGRSDPWVTVAGPAGPAPPAATCGRPEARPASA